MKAVLLDDEPLAAQRLARLLRESGRIEIEAVFTDPEVALSHLRRSLPDVLFLDIEMPGMNGFDLLSRLSEQPLVIFTTAYDRYALRAFEVHSIDYLVKPIDTMQLDRALRKLERMHGGSEPRPDVRQMIEDLATALRRGETAYPTRVASRSGDRTEFIELSRITHFYAKDKLTFAATDEKDHVVDYTITDLETKLDPAQFLRIHRSTLLNVDHVRELHSWFGGRVLVRLKGKKSTDLTVARDRVKELKDRLGI